MKKRMLALLLAALLVLSLGACAKKTETPAADPETTQEPAAPAEPEAPAEAETPAEPEAETPEEAPETDSYYPVTVEVLDPNGEAVPFTFEKAPERTLVYGRNNVEIMLALGLGDNILMIADCGSVLPEYQEAFEKIDQVKNHQDVGYFVREFALSQEPDMVIGWRSLFAMEERMGDIQFWHDRGIGTYTTINSVLRGNESLENEYADIRNIGKIYNKVDEAEEIIAKIQEKVDMGKAAAEGQEPQRILIAEKWEGEYDIYHAGTAAGDIAAQLGAEVLGEKGWTDEQIVAANPEAIFAVHVSSVTPEEAVALYTENPALASVDAVKNGRIYPVVYSLAYAPGVRTSDTVSLFLNSLYGIEA